MRSKLRRLRAPVSQGEARRDRRRGGRHSRRHRHRGRAPRARGPLDQNLIAVAPFDVVDADLKLWHEGMVDVLSRNLDGAGPLRTVSPTLVVRRWTGRADKESAASLGRATGAKLAVFGSLIRSGTDSVRASASVVDALSGRCSAKSTGVTRCLAWTACSDSLTIGLLRELGKIARARRRADVLRRDHLPAGAEGRFCRGSSIFRHSAWDSALANYERAIDSDSTFSIALMYNGLTHGWMGGATDSGAIRTCGARRDSITDSRRETACSSLSSGQFATLGASRPRRAASSRTAARCSRRCTRPCAGYPTDPVVWFALGDAQYHWGWGPQVGVPEREVAHSFDRAIALDSAFTPAYIHAIEMSFRYGTPNGRRYLKGYLAQHPTDVDAEGMRLVARLADPALAGTKETREMFDTASVLQLQHAALASLEWGDSAETLLRIIRQISTVQRGRRCATKGLALVRPASGGRARVTRARAESMTAGASIPLG